MLPVEVEVVVEPNIGVKVEDVVVLVPKLNWGAKDVLVTENLKNIMSRRPSMF